MPKMKPRKTAVKRFKVTGTGKIMRRWSSQNHRLHKSRRRRQEIAMGETQVVGGNKIRIRQMLGVGSK